MAKSACAHGHPLTYPNVYVTAQGFRECRTCKRRRQRAYTLRQREHAAA